MITLPVAPKQYSKRDQDQVRRIIQATLRDMELRLRALEEA